jgi:UDP-N-acetylmuramoylalanine--D-glutamate ligase
MSPQATQAPNAVVVGMGRTGLSVARHLQRSGFRIAVTDSRESPPELEGVKALGASVVTRTGGFDVQLLERADIVVTSPGVPLDDPFFVQARARGLDIVGDIELFARAADAPVVGITGTNGKSTVTTLLGRMAERASVRVRVGGNLGQPALDLLDRGPTDLYVLELSSFQLDTTHSLKLKAAVVLNVSADHMDRYATLKAYAASKARIYANSETAVVNADEPEVVRMPRAGQRVITFSLQDPKADYSLATPAGRAEPWLSRRGDALMPVTALKISGRHNAANALATLALGDALRLPMAPMLEELRDFTGLPHRAQWVADLDGVRYINDSKGTNVGATLAAVGGLAGPLVVIAGGDGKGQDFTPLAPAFRGKVRTAVLLGRDAGLLETALAGICHTLRVGTMEEAVRAARRFAQAGDTVVLSPACSSLDMFRDYAERGNAFATAVRGLA